VPLALPIRYLARGAAAGVGAKCLSNLVVSDPVAPKARPGLELPALWEELKFDATHRRAFRQIAVFGDRRWQGWGTRLFRPLSGAEMRYFDRSKAEEARSWLGL
jgi:hypothetical protein